MSTRDVDSVRKSLTKRSKWSSMPTAPKTSIFISSDLGRKFAGSWKSAGGERRRFSQGIKFQPRQLSRERKYSQDQNVERTAGPTRELVTLATQLSELEVIAIATVFEDIYTTFDILEFSIHNELEATGFLTYRTLIERFSQKPINDPLAGLSDDGDGAEEGGRKECLKITEVLRDTVKELLCKGTYTLFQHVALIPHLIEREEQKLLTDLAENLKRNHNLQAEIHFPGTTSRRATVGYSGQLNKIKGYYRRMIYYNEKRMDYLDKWTTAREYQHKYNMKRKEDTLKKSIDDLQRNINTTIRVHENNMSHYKLEVNNILEKIDHFEQLRVNDKEFLEMNIGTTRTDVDETRELRIMSENIYKNMKEKTDRIRERKRKIIEEEREYRRQTAAVTIIARWWRRVRAKTRRKKRTGKKGKTGKKRKN